MIERRNAADRGHFNFGWLETSHSFSFGEYYDPAHMGFSVLRVINEDYIAPSAGFPTHGHRDMEIVTYVLEGAVAHKDSMGNGSIIKPGDVQRMSAGTGVTHSEYNGVDEVTELLQIWLLPAEHGLPPSYEQKAFDPAGKRGRLRLVASPDGADGSVRLHQDVRLYAGLFDGDEATSWPLAGDRKAYVHVARGELTVNGEQLAKGDALKMMEIDSIEISAGREAEVLVFDLP
ncbi:MAG: pirin family protein [Gammaproteobacteria bacterium]|nr:pirin family protein [Gammaproteobacteria bacterium]